jgi:hypothetical protein
MRIPVSMRMFFLLKKYNHYSKKIKGIVIPIRTQFFFSSISKFIKNNILINIIWVATRINKGHNQKCLDIVGPLFLFITLCLSYCFYPYASTFNKNPNTPERSNVTYHHLVLILSS